MEAGPEHLNGRCAKVRVLLAARYHVLRHAREFWDTKTLGRFPRSYTRLHDAWTEHDLWGSVESRWELEKCEIDLPVRTGSP